jgi:hypothetical protein
MTNTEYPIHLQSNRDVNIVIPYITSNYIIDTWDYIDYDIAIRPVIITRYFLNNFRIFVGSKQKTPFTLKEVSTSYKNRSFFSQHGHFRIFFLCFLKH